MKCAANPAKRASQYSRRNVIKACTNDSASFGMTFRVIPPNIDFLKPGIVYCIAPQNLKTGKIMDLINWSLNAIDTIFSTRSSGSGEPNCPDGTYPAGYTMDAGDRWRVVCLAALSVEDIEDIYLFGTMITGLLLIGLGFALGYRRIKETGTAVQSLTRLPVMIEAVGRAVSIETETINRNMDSITEKLTALQRKIDGDQNGQ